MAGQDNSGIWKQGPQRNRIMLKLRKLEKFFETKAGRIYVLRNIDLDVAEGEFLTIMGPSGAGKSSLLGIVGLLDAAWQGEYYLLDQPVHRLNLKQRAELNKRTIGFVFQQYHLLDNLTVYENLEIPLSYRNIPRSLRGHCRGHAGSLQHRRQERPVSEPAVRRTTEARCSRARSHRQSQTHPRRRANR